MRYLKRILIVGFVLFGIISDFSVDHRNFYAINASRQKTSPTLIIDAGHGGEDGGAVSLSGASESQINLSIALKLDQILGLYGLPVMLTRSEDISLHDKNAKTLHDKKVSDLQNRVAIAQSLQYGVLISIHQNSYPSPKYSGAQVFFAPTEQSDQFANIMQNSLRYVLNPNNNRLPKEIPSTIYLMNHVSCCAILVECGFLTNPQEEALLLNVSYQTKMATALAGGYLEFTKELGESIL